MNAPAGYGKTTAVVEALATEKTGGVAWLSIDAYDATELSFWVHLAASIDLVRPGVLRQLADGSSAIAELDGIKLAATLLGALQPEDELTIVFDDLHHLASRALWEQLSFFLERLPPGCRAIGTTRSAIPLPVERWQSQQRMTVIDQQILRFDTTEATRLVAEITQQGMTEAEVDQLVARSEGWAVGLIFEALTSAKTFSSDGPGSRETPRPSRTVINYLATEVLDTLSVDDRQFLLSISVLDEFDNDLCRRVTGETDAGERLRSLQVANLFLVPVGDAAGRFRFHHLFRELLLEELDRRDPGRRIALHRRAAEAAAANGSAVLQIHHLIEAGDTAVAFDLVVHHARQEGSLVTARELINVFPDSFLYEDPRRMLDYALVLGLAGDWEMAEHWCTRWRQQSPTTRHPCERGSSSSGACSTASMARPRPRSPLSNAVLPQEHRMMKRL